MSERLNHNPDVLSCLANLSNDEVLTPPEVANAMLDMLPQELFRDPNAKFLDPACKSGIFLREIAKRLLDGLKDSFPDRQKRIDHIFHKQLYGIAITELTSLLARRSLYCSKYANSIYSVTSFEETAGKIRFKRIEHTWNGEGKCQFCGASREQFDRGDELETHAYEFIHNGNIKELEKVKFDLIISNPPYQLSDGGNNASAIPIYQKFAEIAFKLNPRYVCMIIPSRWYSGGRNLDAFRALMINSTQLKEIHDFQNAEQCFPGVDISGGICYFLWDKQYNGPCKFYNMENPEIYTSRILTKYPIVIRSNQALPILEKIASYNEKTLDNVVSSQRPFGLRTFARPENDGELVLRWNGGKGPYPRNLITVGESFIKKWKVIVSRVFYEHAGKANSDGQVRVLSILEILAPDEICTETYIVVNSFDTQEEAINLLKYLRTKFARFLILQATSSIMISKNSFGFVPLLDFHHSYEDQDLYRKYKLDDSEISYIESKIKPMNEGVYDA